MKLRAALLSLGAALGSCPLVNAVDLDLSRPLCSSADLAPALESGSPGEPVVVITTCEAGSATTRDSAGQTYTRSWRETLRCDLHLTGAARGVALRACPRSR